MIRRVAADQRGFRSNEGSLASECDETHVTGRFRLNRIDGGLDCDETHTGDEAVATLAARQCGVVTTAQLAAAGLGERAVAHRVSCRWLTRLYRGVYQVGPVPGVHAREMAAVLVTGGVLSHHSAAAEWGFRPPHDGDVHVTTTKTARSRRGIRVHRSASLNAAVHLGLPLTTPARTLHDLAPLLPRHELDRAVEEAEIRKLVQRDELRPALRGTDEPRFTRSEAERRLLKLVRAAKLPVPVTNTKVAGWEVDAIWPRYKLIVEVDGYAYHGNRAAFERDRRKDAALVAAGYRVVRITWRQIVDEPHTVVALLARLLPP
jgi:very-short-patch-repair endonuclease